MPETRTNDENHEGLEDAFDLRRWVQLVRVGVYVLVLLLAVVTNISQKQFTNWDLLRSFYLFSLIGLLGHAIEFWGLERVYKSRALLFFSFLFDVVLITLLSAQTHLNDSLFLFMYMATILVGSLLTGVRTGMIFAGSCSVAYSVATLLGPEVKSLHVFFLMIVNNFGFFSMAWLGGRFSEDLESVEQKLSTSNMSLESLRKIQSMIVDSVSSGLVTTHQSGQILTVNPAALKIFGPSIQPGIEMRELLGLSGEERRTHFEKEWGSGTEKKLLKVQKHLAVREASMGPVEVWTIDDLTESRRLEMSLRQSEKMAAIGGLAAGIAHEIRNPLAGISGSVELLGESTKEEEGRLKKIILREINRLNNLITEFLDYSKPDEGVRDSVALESVIRECVEFLKPQSPGVDFQMDLASLKIIGNSQKLRQVFMNMILNSIQAMNNSEQKRLEISLRKKENLAQVRIRDTGCGISEKNKSRIFEPFMTTKPKGTGLGLAMTHKILEAHRAKIFVESQLGQGTEFLIEFPVPD